MTQDDIIPSWKKNASEWIKAMEENSIASRKFTNRAILNTLVNLNPKKLVDIGCGEGWLTREIADTGAEAVGLDAIEALILEARRKGKESYHVFTFEDIISGKDLPNSPFDVAVFNFCLYLENGLQPLLENTLKAINPNGYVVIQTLHPYFLLQGELPYKSQWLSDSWKGLPGNFTDGHAWYARTLEDWSKILASIENTNYSVEEVVNDQQMPVSLIIKIQKVS